MPSICFYFRAHQPNRLKQFTFFEIGTDHFYEDDDLNKHYLDQVSESCYLPTNALMMELIERYEGKFKICMSLTGTFIEQMEHHRPDVLESFKKLHQTGCLELIAETYYHSLASEYSVDEFKRQVKLLEDKYQQHFGVKPTALRNTEMIYSNRVAQLAQELDYEAVLAEGVDWYLNGRTPNQLYQAPSSGIKLLLRNHRLTDEIAFRFPQGTLTADQYAFWLSQADGDNINIFMDYETIGEHIKAGTGIFDFMRWLPHYVLMYENLSFKTVREVIDTNRVKGIYDVHFTTSWADAQRDMSAWNGNAMQDEALTKLYSMEYDVKGSNDPDFIHVWSKLQTSDHFYYISTKPWGDGTIHEHFSPYNSAYEGYIFYMNALSDLEITVNELREAKKTGKHKAKTTTAPPQLFSQADLEEPTISKKATLIDIKGIGPKYVKILAQAGIDTFEKLINLSNEDWDVLEKEHTGIIKRCQKEQWIQQAKELAD
ncbi:MAG: hypothetical protein R2798_10620 [Chitinophagales bacterium]|nr:alpha-amylase [Bacteroidota bacterium]MCB9043991.1 alpha-amylase [Chitinophagales bacterium]